MAQSWMEWTMMRKLLLLACLLVFTSVAFGQVFDIYVSDAGNFQNPPWQILKYDENGENPEVFISQNLAYPQDILFLEGSRTVLISNLNSGDINDPNEDRARWSDLCIAVEQYRPGQTL
jgi:hypothetical protein